MANISRLLQLSAGISRGIDLSTNTLVVGSITVGGGSGTTLGKSALDALLAISSNLASTATGFGASLVGIEDFATIYAATTVEGALAEVKGVADGAVSVNTTQSTNIGNLVTLSGVAVNSTHLGSFSGTVGGTLASDTVKQAIQGLATAIDNTNSVINKWTWMNSCADKLNTPPVSPVTGANYLVGTVPTDDFIGHANAIATYTGSIYTFQAPALGYAVLVATHATSMFVYGGSAWAEMYFESTTASTGLTKSGFDVQLANANAGGIAIASGALSVNVDGSTITLGAGNSVGVPTGGIGTTQIAANAVTEAKIKLTNNGNLKARNAADSADISILKVDASDNIMFAAIPYGPASAPGANYQMANKKYVDDQVSAGSSKTIMSVVVGESMAANTSFAVRFAIPSDAGYVAGRVYKADQDTTTADKFQAVGFIQTTTALAAGDSIPMIMLGSLAIGSADSAFAAGDVGKPIYLNAAGAFSTTAPSTDLYAVKTMGYVETTTVIFVMPMQGALVN